jgi:netrin-G1 ligand/leucine-rich repeat/fibronectin type-III domain-containing protein 5
MLWLKEFFDNKPDIFKGAQPPACMTPSLVTKKQFNRLTSRDFRCQAPIFNDVDLMFANENGQLSCSASGDPAPMLYWVKPSGERNAYPPPSGLFPVKTDAKLIISHVEGIYTGSYECLAVNAGGNVTLTMNVTWPKIERKTIVKYIEREPIFITPAPLPDNIPKEPVNDKSTNSNSNNSEITVDDFKIFTMLELVSAVLGTFVSTVLVSVIVFHLLFRIRSSKFHRNRLEGPYSPNTSVYLARSSEEEYMKDAVYSRPR